MTEKTMYRDYKCNPNSHRVDDHGGVISVGWRPSENDRSFEFAFNFCSPFDEYDKWVSRTAINGRLDKKHNYYVEIGVGSMTSEEREEIIKTILYGDWIHCPGEFNIPNWFENVLNQEMVTFIVPKTLLNYCCVEQGYDFDVPAWSMIKNR